MESETTSYPSYPISYIRDILNETSTTTSQEVDQGNTINEAQTSDNTSLLTIGFVIIVVAIIGAGLYFAVKRGK